jgi:hypothetical protein
MNGRPKCSSNRCASAESRSIRSGLSDEERALTGVEMIADLDETIARSIARAEDRRVTVIPERPYVVPITTRGERARTNNLRNVVHV